MRAGYCLCGSLVCEAARLQLHVHGVAVEQQHTRRGAICIARTTINKRKTTAQPWRRVRLCRHMCRHSSQLPPVLLQQMQHHLHCVRRTHCSMPLTGSISRQAPAHTLASCHQCFHQCCCNGHTALQLAAHPEQASPAMQYAGVLLKLRSILCLAAAACFSGTIIAFCP